MDGSIGWAATCRPLIHSLLQELQTIFSRLMANHGACVSGGSLREAVD